MCGYFAPDYSDTEYICDFCSGKDEDGVDHDFCDALDRACACRNADHALTTPAMMYQKFMDKLMEKSREPING